MTLTQKENSLLTDLKSQEQLCIEKYTKYAEMAHDTELRTLFNNLKNNEQKHLDTLTKLESGTVPSAGGASSAMPTFSAHYTSANESAEAHADAYLCTDLLSGEKHVSHLYDTAIFEFTDENARELLGGIQKREQMHGKMIYDYMKANGMY